MESTLKRHKGSEKDNGINRLSELPDQILVHILSFLPIVDAVRTLLIRRFGYLWTLLPSLIFDDLQFLKAGYGPCAKSNYDEFILRYPNFVRNVLVLHKRVPIDNFNLRFYLIDVYNDDNKLFVNEVTTWLRFAIDREVKDLEVVEVHGFILPRCVFTSPFLVTLKLAKCGVLELSQVQMRSLRKLSLSDVEISNQVFKKIIQGSPSLQELALNRIVGLNELRFAAPNIDKLYLAWYDGLLDCPNLKILDITTISVMPLQMVDLSSVREVNIRFCYKLNVLDAFLKKFCNAEVFKFSDENFQSSSFNGQDIPQTKWKRLHIKSRLSGGMFLGICRVLRSSPHLEELIVYTDSQHGSDITHDNNIPSLELSSCLMQQLKHVTIRGYKLPCHGLLQLAEFLLKSSVILEKMVILPSKDKSAAFNEVKFLKQLVSFPRASSNARVIFGSELY